MIIVVHYMVIMTLPMLMVVAVLVLFSSEATVQMARRSGDGLIIAVFRKGVAIT